jgi:hypothetical protein
MHTSKAQDAWTRRHVIELNREGLSAGVVARYTGLPVFTVRRIVRQAGLDWDVAEQMTASQIERLANLRRMRALTAERLLVRANQFLDMMDQPYLVYSFGGKDNVFNSTTLERPPTGALRDLMVSAALAIKSSSDLVRFDADAGLETSRTLLDAIAAGIEEAATQLGLTRQQVVDADSNGEVSDRVAATLAGDHR